MSKGKQNRTMGHNGERHYAKIFREMGFTFCKTTRQSNRMMDNCGIDLNFLPFNVQIKTGVHKSINHRKVLKYIDDRRVELFLPEDQIHKKLNILIHRKAVGRGKKRKDIDDLVYVDGPEFRKFLDNSKVRKQCSYLSIPINNKLEIIQFFTENNYRNLLVENLSEKWEWAKYKKLHIMSFKTFKNIIKSVELK